MADLDRLLESFGTDNATVAPPPAAEIRQRGDRLRRRNRRLQAAGGALALALVATPLALFVRVEDDAAPVPPADRLVVQVPGEFPLLSGVPNFSYNGDEVGVKQGPEDSTGFLAPCPDGDTWSFDELVTPTDVASTRYYDGYIKIDRQVTVYPSPEDAARNFAAIDALFVCPRTRSDTYTEHESPFVGDSLVVSRQVDDNDNIDMFVIARTGNGLYTSRTFVAADLDTAVQRAITLSTPPVESLAVFDGGELAATAGRPTLTGEAVVSAPDLQRATGQAWDRQGPDIEPATCRPAFGYPVGAHLAEKDVAFAGRPPGSGWLQFRVLEFGDDDAAAAYHDLAATAYGTCTEDDMTTVSGPTEVAIDGGRGTVVTFVLPVDPDFGGEYVALGTAVVGNRQVTVEASVGTDVDEGEVRALIENALTVAAEVMQR